MSNVALSRRGIKSARSFKVSKVGAFWFVVVLTAGSQIPVSAPRLTRAEAEKSLASFAG